MNMASHDLAGIIGIMAIWTTLGAFFAGYYFAKRKSKKHIEKSGGKITETQSNGTAKEENSKRTTKKFDWI